MTRVVPIASGKGGVGKSVISANLALALSRLGKTVVCVDLDLGGSNLHTLLGVRNNKAGLGGYISGRQRLGAAGLESLLVETEHDRLYFVPGDALVPGTANLNYFRKQKIIREMAGLTADFVIVDLGAGSSYNTVDFYLAGTDSLIITTSEITSILNAYSFLKASLYRLLYRSFPAKSEERNYIQSRLMARVEGSEETYAEVAAGLSSISAESRDRAMEQIRTFVPQVVVNMARSSKDLAVSSRLRHVTEKNLGTRLSFVAVVGHDENVSYSIAKRTPALALNPDSGFAEQLMRLAQKLVSEPSPTHAELFEADEDLEELAREASGEIDA